MGITNSKLIVTLGPSTRTEADLRALKNRGVDFVRINMSHSTLEDLKYFLDLAKRVGLPFIVDTEGSQVRTGDMKKDSLDLQENQEVKVFADPHVSGHQEITLKPAHVLPLLEKGDILHVDFNNAILRVIDTATLPDGFIRARAISAGRIGRNKAVVVDSAVPKLFNLPALSEKDHQSIELGLKAGTEHIAASFMRSAAFVEEVKRATRGKMKVISKLECVDALNNLDEIIEASDYLLLDRGDLSKEVPIEKIPYLQKHILQQAKKIGRELFVATNFLESMITSKGPTRAEVNDVVNAILDGASGLILSAETAIGRYPMRCVNMMKKLMVEAEAMKNGTAKIGNEHLIEPHGGRLVDRVLYDLPNLDFQRLPQIPIDDETYMDLEQIAIGTFSPLEGFMTEAELRSVLEKMRLPNGTTWPLPVILNVPSKVAEQVKVGQSAVLSDRAGQPVGLINISDKYTFDLDEFARLLFGTEDENHPGVARVKNYDPWFVGGEIQLLKRRPSVQKEYELTPRQARHLFSERGWQTVVGFHTRNVIHRSHEFIQLLAMDQVSADGLFVHPVVGKKKPGDFEAEYIVKAYEKMMEKYYPEDSVVLGTFATYSRYAGPREALFTAICRQNFGCSHFVIGRDHTGVGEFYHPKASHEIFDQFPDLKITPLRFNEVFYSKNLGRHVHEVDPSEHLSDDKLQISGTEARKMLERGEHPPGWFMRPEISQILVDAIKLGKKLFVEAEVPRKSGYVLWFTGLSGSGKSTIARAVKQELEKGGKSVVIIDGDVVRASRHKHLGFSRQDIRQNNRLVAELAREESTRHDFVLVPMISPYREDRANARNFIGRNFLEIFVSCPLEECIRRDTKGLYQKAAAGEMVNLVGFSPGYPYEAPENPDLTLDTVMVGQDENVNYVLSFLNSQEVDRED